MPQTTTTENDPQALEALRARLLARRALLQADVELDRARLAEPGSATGNTFVAGNEGAVADAEDGMAVSLWQHAQHELDEVQAALQRLEGARFGRCEDCDEPIGRARLDAQPEARRCLRCQSALEAQQHRGA